MPLMEIIRFAELKESNWKNGGGITREIANAAIAASPVWRVSLADVSADGPFSDFSDFVRILTVVKGQGMILQSDSGDFDAKPRVPVRFSGALKIHGQLKSDFVHNFNFMFNPDYCTGDVTVLDAPQTRSLALTERHQFAVHCLTGTVTIDDGDQLLPGDTAFIGADGGQVTVTCSDAAVLISIELIRGVSPGSLVVTTR